jgi:hypothetical protein
VPLMQPERKMTNEQLTVTLPSDTLQELRAYARFLNNSSVSYVLVQLIATLSRDKEFQHWKAGQNGRASEFVSVGSSQENAHGKSA